MDLWLSPHDARVRILRERGSLFLGHYESHVGPCVGVSDGERLIALRFSDTDTHPGEFQQEWPGITFSESHSTAELIARVFVNPAEVPVMAIGTPFQLTVWEYLRRSATASTMTYGEVARSIGRPTAARAIGQAVGANPLAVVIPCHRVVSKGKLTGYRWGLERKKALLTWELSRKDPLEMPF